MITYILADNITPSTLSLLSQLNASLLGMVDSGVTTLGARINEVNESLALATAAVDSDLRQALSGSACLLTFIPLGCVAPVCTTLVKHTMKFHHVYSLPSTNVSPSPHFNASYPALPAALALLVEAQGEVHQSDLLALATHTAANTTAIDLSLNALTGIY